MGSAGTLLPTSGSFTYDSTADTFSDFDVTWNGVTYDLTASANSPGAGSGGVPSCIGSLTGAAASFALLDGACASPGPSFSTQWAGDPGPSSNFLFYTTNGTKICLSIVGPGEGHQFAAGYRDWRMDHHARSVAGAGAIGRGPARVLISASGPAAKAPVGIFQMRRS